MNINVTSLTDEELNNLVKNANKEMDRRQREKQKAAKEMIRKIASEHDIKISFAENAPVPRRKKSMSKPGRTVTATIMDKTSDH